MRIFSDPNTYQFILGMFIVVIFLLKVNWLVEKYSFRIVLSLTVALFMIGIVSMFVNPTIRIMPNYLVVPLISLLLFRLCRWIFILYLKREPCNPFDLVYDMTPGLFWDRLFTISYFVTVAMLMIILK